jgi:hypothetical protein
MTSRQLTVTVDHDSDETRIEVVDPRSTPRRQFVVVKTKYPSQVLEVLENVFNLLDVRDVELQKQDEGRVRTVEEW